MMTASPSRLASQRCFHHGGREAVARCVSCRRAYCRECVAEHGGRMICAACLRRENERAPATPRRWSRALAGSVLTVVAVFVAWSFFFGLAELLREIPAPVHEGTIWLGE